MEKRGSTWRELVWDEPFPTQRPNVMAIKIHREPSNFEYFYMDSPMRTSQPPLEEGLCSHFTEKQRGLERMWQRSCYLLLQCGLLHSPDLPLHIPWASSCLLVLQMPCVLTGQFFLTIKMEKLIMDEALPHHPSPTSLTPESKAQLLRAREGCPAGHHERVDSWGVTVEPGGLLLTSVNWIP